MMTVHESNELAQAINARNARRAHQADAALGFVVALVVGILGAAALVHYLTPCDAATLCAGAVIPTRPGLRLRAAQWLRTVYLRFRIRAALADVAGMQQVVDQAQQELDYLPRQIDAHKAWIDLHMAELDALERPGLRGARSVAGA